MMNYTTNSTTSLALQPDLEHSLEVLLIVCIYDTIWSKTVIVGEISSHTLFMRGKAKARKAVTIKVI